MKNAHGKDLVAALIAGYEVANRVAVALQPAHWFGGFQATGTIGTIGAAAAAGSLIGLSASNMEAALGMAGTILPLSNGDSSFKGYTAKTVQAGEAATRGIEAAFMARAGFTAGPLEGEPPRHHAFMYLMGGRHLDGAADVAAAALALTVIAARNYTSRIVRQSSTSALPTTTTDGHRVLHGRDAVHAGR